MATFEVRILNLTNRSLDVLGIRNDHVFKKPCKFIGYGWEKFITTDKLRSGSYIEKDTIFIQVHMSTKNFENIAD